MTEVALFLLVVMIAGIYATRWSLRLSRPDGELALKTIVATALAGTVALGALFGLTAGSALRWVALVGGPLYVFGPLIAIMLARGRRYDAARRVVAALYWGADARSAFRRLIAQVALQQGDAGAALDLAGERDPLLLAQAHAQREEWEEVLRLDLPEEGDNSFLGDAARVQALLALGREEEAGRATSRLRARWEAQAPRQGPLGYRALQLSEARLAAERGEFDTVRRLLQQPLPGVPAHQLFGILARAAERGQHVAEAARLYAQAFVLAPEGARASYARKLEEYGAELPEPAKRRVPVGTLTLVAGVAAAFVLQQLLDGAAGLFRTPVGALDASSVAAAFLLNIPGVPEGAAPWRYLSYALVHGNIVHIGFNAWVLFDIGRLYEARRSWGDLIAAFVFGTVMGAYLTTIAQSAVSVVLVGASGGVLGVAGALLADALRSRLPSDRPLTRSLLQWMALIALISVAIPNVSLWGHVGGVVGGLLWGFMRQGLPAGQAVGRAAGVAGAVLLLYALARAARVAFGLL